MPSLSQRYRPKRFSEITGQQHITETLRKEVATQKLGHAYLFCGPRGVGKTTAARVFAKALNCEKLEDGEPCNVCASCVAANQGRLLDLIELDAATHTGVDTVREAIIEHVRFAPTTGKRKIYILDEAHMLSPSSWNALLKTLEEPPPYAFFILATTEWHKVPATIVSRCQRFEFKRVSDEALAERIREISRLEGWTLDEDVVKLVASRADGCVRDAETLLGQLGSLGEAHVDAKVAHLVIPESHLPLAAGLMKRWADRDHAGSLTEAERLSSEGIPLLPLFDDALQIVRKLLAVSGDPKLAEAWKSAEEEDRSLADLVGRFEPGELADMALLLMDRRKDVKAGVDPLFALQLAGTMVACGLLKHSEAKSTPVILNEVRRNEGSPAGRGSFSPSNSAQDDKTEPETIKKEIIPSVQDTPPGILDLATVRSKWNAFIRAVDEKNHSLPFILKICQAEEVRGSTLVIRFQYPFHRDKVLADTKHRRVVEECAREIFHVKDLILEGTVGEDPERKEVRSTDMVTNILKAFGGSVVE